MAVADPEPSSQGAGRQRLWLVRHARPLVKPGTCYGRLNVAADPEATGLCAGQLAEVLPPGFVIITSPLQRCEQLAGALIGLRPDLVLKRERRLEEMDFGGWEGRAWADIPRPELAAWTAEFGSYRAGATGECVNSFMARVTAVFDELTPDTLWITHAGVIRAARLLACGLRHISRADQWPTQAPAYGQWCTLDIPAIPATQAGVTPA